MSIISIPKILREKLGEDGSDALINVLNEQEEKTAGSVIDTAELRFERKLAQEIGGLEKRINEEISGLRGEMQESVYGLRGEMYEGISGLRGEMHSEISKLREDMVRGESSLREDIQKSKTDTIKWMFIFWIGQIGALLGILLAVFK
jgi:hypothetical protein